MSTTELILACADSNDGAAWEEFVARFRRPVCLSILRTASKWGAIPHQVADDLAQETYLKLCADRCRLLKALALKNPDAVEAYIKSVAINLAHDHFKSQYAQKRGAGAVMQFPEESGQPIEGDESRAQQHVERAILMREIGDCLQASCEGPDRERDLLIFWLYYRQGLTAKAIAALPTVGLSVKGVESAVLRLTRLVRERLSSLRTPTSALAVREKGIGAAESFQ